MSIQDLDEEEVARFLLRSSWLPVAIVISHFDSPLAEDLSHLRTRMKVNWNRHTSSRR